MEDSGLIDIQPHGYDHTPLTELSPKDIRYHISLATGLIEMHLGARDVNVLAYPQFLHNWHTVQILNDLDFDFQMTNLANYGIGRLTRTAFAPPKLQRINVPNTLSPDDLITTLDQLTT